MTNEQNEAIELLNKSLDRMRAFTIKIRNTGLDATVYALETFIKELPKAMESDRKRLEVPKDGTLATQTEKTVIERQSRLP